MCIFLFEYLYNCMYSLIVSAGLREAKTFYRAFNSTPCMGHIKCATLFGIITPMFRGGFLHFLHQWKQEKILYRGITKFATLPQLCLYTT